MEIKKTEEKGILILEIQGDLDASSAIYLDDAIKQATTNGQNHILIDCSRMNYISSAGLGVFISHIEDFKERKGKFVFCNMQENVYSVFHILGLDKIMSISKSKEEAKKVLNES